MTIYLLAPCMKRENMLPEGGSAVTVLQRVECEHLPTLIHGGLCKSRYIVEVGHLVDI